MNLDTVKSLIRDVPDFPKEGILFKDITPVLSNSEAFRFVVKEMASRLAKFEPDYVAGIESRGFIFGAAIANELGCGLSLVRKPGKLPYKTQSEEYSLEYGTDRLELHVDAFEQGSRVCIVDDLLATGGTAKACASLCKKLGAEVSLLCCLIELKFLEGRQKLDGLACESLIHY